MSGTDQYLSLFLEEAKEQLQALNALLLTLEKNPQEKEALDEVFRVAHTLKGMAAAMGFEGIQALTHAMEEVFGVLKTTGQGLPPNTMDLLFSCLDVLSREMDAIEAGSYEDTRHAVLCSQLQELLAVARHGEAPPAATVETPAVLPSPDTAVSAAVSPEVTTWLQAVTPASLPPGVGLHHLQVQLVADAAMPAVRAFMIQEALQSAGYTVRASLPGVENLEDIPDTQLAFHWLFTAPDTAGLTEALAAALDTVADVASFTVQELIPPGAPDVPQVPDSQTTPASGITAPASDHLPPLEPFPDLSQLGDDGSLEPASNGSWGGGGHDDAPVFHSARTVRVGMDRIDHLVDLVGELVIGRTRIAQYAYHQESVELLSLVHAMSGVTTAIQELVMQFRMEPVERMFSRFPRMVRDLAKSLDKSVELVLNGQNTEVDRVVNEELASALVHVIRNALDHGIEPPAERARLNKSPYGTLELSASNQGDCTTITVCDDGRGISADKILQKAIAKGLTTPDEARRFSEREIFDLIFLPGFSTADVTTEISGRGVGMDVVKHTVEKLGGHIEIFSRPGQGTRFVMTLPSSMAIINVLLVRVGEETYALPLASIQEVVACEDVRRVQRLEVLTLREKTLPLIRLGERLGGPAATRPQGNAVLAVIVRLQEQAYAFQVDALIGQQEAVVKSLPRQASGDNTFTGVMTLANGEVALILNPGNLVHTVRKELKR